MTWYHELGIKYPLFQGGMAWASNAELVAAVSNNGALGIIGSGGRTANELRRMIRKTKTLTSQPFGVNLMLLDKNIKQLLEVICEEKISVVTTGAGSPKEIIDTIIANNIKLFPVVPNKEIALKMLNLPISGIIVEGNEAGGHVGSQNLASLLKEIAPICPLPLIAAGGIYDHHTASLANILGANGVQVGTAFLLEKECQISPIYQELICKGEENGTSLISDKNGHLTRLLNISSEYPLNKSLKAAVEKGDLINGAFMAGSSSAYLEKIEPVENIIQRIMKK
ncbi:2-nitropropane dioxygenase [Lactococcus lactis subsp. lactis]|uniref:Probable nitronate monooxygenase n=1 Tax=Lactococcus lactis subsp. lactis TaxID=1360 RepID=A0A1V0NHW2_LACLL|nr:nitronate monooxygenase [Lactococcus lactis]MRL87227.1 2-nitropropane dioxygenase [Lactococcus cremoris]ADZ64345.1 2-nitropropane deoxygenase [Lactococcus lactis subsp. lactis CV56]ARD99469.1 Dioxygenase [Lactococcus lactis subsp. lactis]EHE93823.1 Oxidoreductase acting on the CH-CH group of donors with NAD(+) or NADP(+) as acceptor [Lactococcus lactis subsp. lactis CNCM I-1631]KAF0954985.1 2-nitropropane dioxygenase [Lactococcus lactis subsp. lactis]